MAKAGYILKAADYDSFDTNVEWMKLYGCEQVIGKENGHKNCSQWKQLMARLERGGKIVYTPKFTQY